MKPITPRSSIGKAIDGFLFAAGLTLKRTTLVSYERCLKPLRCLNKPVSRITLDDLREAYSALRARRTRFARHRFRAPVDGGLSVYTLHKHVRVWKRFFNWLVEEGILTASPARRLKRPRLPGERPKDLKYEDLLRLLDASRTSSLRDYALVCLLAGAAIRAGGLAGLKIDDVDFEARTVRVHEKGDRTRSVCMPRRAARALRRYLEEERPRNAGDCVFAGLRGPLTPGGVYQALKRLAHAAGVQGRFNPHAFRHGFARGAIKRGANPKEVQEILGHADVRTTLMYYATYWEEEIHDRHDAVSWLPEEEGQGEEGQESGRDARKAGG